MDEDTSRDVAEDILVRLRTAHGREASVRDVVDALVGVGHAVLALDTRLREHREAVEKLGDRVRSLESHL